MVQTKKRHVPINLRQSGDFDAKMLLSTRVRKSPYFHLAKQAGCWCYTVYNRIYHPRAYIPLEDGGLLAEYEYLTKHVSMWDVAVERQIQIKGPDAVRFGDYVITRSVEKIEVGKARYVILCNLYGGIINDPVLLRPAEDEFCFSLADSDVGIYLQGVNAVARMDVEINEIDVCPVQIQGPKSESLLAKLIGPEIHALPYYGLLMGKQVGGCDVTISRSGFSGEAGYEIYLHDATINADAMWNAVLEAGKEFNLKVIAPGHIRRIEAGILSWGQDMDIETNPYEVGLGWQVDFDKPDFIGKEALAEIKKQGVTEKLVGLRMGGEPITWYPSNFYTVRSNGEDVGYVTSAFWSPAQDSNIALAMVPVGVSEVGTSQKVVLSEGHAEEPVDAEVVKTPFKASDSPGTGLLKTGAKL